MAGTVESVSRIPTAPGQYTVAFTVAVADQSYLHPGMTCAIQLRVLDKPKAVTIPSKALRATLQGGTMVWVKTKTGHLEREVTPGNSHAGKTEITEGLNEGDEVPRLPDVKPPGNAVVEKSIERGVYFLLGNQNKDGSWGTPRNTKGLNIYAPTYHSHYAFRLAVTALCTSALIEAGGDTPQVRAAIQDSEAYLLEH